MISTRQQKADEKISFVKDLCLLGGSIITTDNLATSFNGPQSFYLLKIHEHRKE